MAPPTKIQELATLIASRTETIDAYLREHGLPSPSFDVEAPGSVGIPAHETETAAALATVISATEELHNLLLGPMGVLMEILCVHPNNVLSLHGIYRYGLASAFVPGASSSFEEISKTSGLNQPDLERILRHAMSNHIFREEKGMVSHSAISRVIAENPIMRDFVGMMCEELFAGAPRTIDALVKYGGSHAPKQSGFSLGHNTQKGLYDELQQYPDRGRRFAGAMASFATKVSIDPLAQNYDWASLASNNATIIDIGGGWGPVSIGLAERFPNLQFVVQDLANVVADGPSHVPPELQERIRFMTASCLEEQPIKGAAVYFLRAILHNFPDEYIVRILRNQVKAMTIGAHIVINETILDNSTSEGRSPYQTKFQRSMDLNMLTFFGAREHTLGDWESLLAKADSRFKLEDVNIRGGLLVIGWTG